MIPNGIAREESLRGGGSRRLQSSALGLGSTTNPPNPHMNSLRNRRL